jgi:hypothetical protein
MEMNKLQGQPIVGLIDPQNPQNALNEMNVKDASTPGRPAVILSGVASVDPFADNTITMKSGATYQINDVGVNYGLLMKGAFRITNKADTGYYFAQYKRHTYVIKNFTTKAQIFSMVVADGWDINMGQTGNRYPNQGPGPIPGLTMAMADRPGVTFDADKFKLGPLNGNNLTLLPNTSPQDIIAQRIAACKMLNEEIIDQFVFKTYIRNQRVDAGYIEWAFSVIETPTRIFTQIDKNFTPHGGIQK